MKTGQISITINPFHTSSAKKLNITDPPIITVVGRAFFDVGHAPKGQSNRRSYLPGYAAWEIHPVMTLEYAMIEIRPHRWGWKVFEAPGVEPVFPEKDQAINYAQSRASFRSGEIRILDLTGKLERTIAFNEADRKL
jgi:hypothetical protein